MTISDIEEGGDIISHPHNKSLEQNEAANDWVSQPLGFCNSVSGHCSVSRALILWLSPCVKYDVYNTLCPFYCTGWHILLAHFLHSSRQVGAKKQLFDEMACHFNFLLGASWSILSMFPQQPQLQHHGPPNQKVSYASNALLTNYFTPSADTSYRIQMG